MRFICICVLLVAIYHSLLLMFEYRSKIAIYKHHHLKHLWNHEKMHYCRFLTPLYAARNQIGLLIAQILMSKDQIMLFFAKFTQIILQLLLWLG